MDPQRWMEIERLYHLAREREAGEREKFLAEACGGDELLRREVESLLARPPEGQDFLEVPALEVAARAFAKDRVNLPPIDMTGRTIAHYRILEKIGEGGMGVVYKARDAHLDRTIAIKVLPAEAMADAERRRRFVQEAKAASALNHPGIVQIYDINSDGGVDFIAMEYVAGKTLDRCIGRLRIGEALKYGVQIADAIAAAHAAGIVHRDLKPANIMVTETGLLKILDFGLAKLTQPIQREVSGTGSSMEPLTGEGRIMGTVAYMSPEQALGQELDVRSDLFSFAVVLYEMATGTLPFRGSTLAALFDSILHKAPISPVRLKPDLPDELEHIVKKALEKDRKLRYQSSSDMRADLERLKRDLDSGCLVTSMAAEPVRIPSLAVLPFANLSADKENEYFSDGLAEDIIDALTHVPGLRVMARTSAFAFRGKEQDVRKIGAKLSVENILEGSVRRAGNRVRVTAQLVKARDGYQLWSQRFDREMTDVFAIQDEISQAIVEKLRVQLAGDRPLVKRHTENVDAYHLFLRGRHCMFRMTPESLTKSKEYLEQAIALDPNYALAYAGMAEYYFWSAHWAFKDPREALPKFKSAAMEAVSQDDTLAEAHSMLGLALGPVGFDWAGAEREFRRAIELNPASPIVRFYYGFFFLQPMGRLDEGSSQLQRAMELDPLSSLYNTLLAYLYYARGQCDLAIAQHRRAMDLDPSFFAPHWLLSAAYAHMGRLEEAIAEAQKACELSGRHALALGLLGLAYELSGRRSEARALLEELTTKCRTTYVPPTAMVAVYRGLGELDQTLGWLEKGVEERDLIVVCCLKSEPLTIPVQGHPRYQTLLRKMNLEP